MKRLMVIGVVLLMAGFGGLLGLAERFLLGLIFGEAWIANNLLAMCLVVFTSVLLVSQLFVGRVIRWMSGMAE